MSKDGTTLIEAFALQETFTPFNASSPNRISSSEHGEFRFLDNGIDGIGSRLRGTGVSILLSPSGVSAFKKANCQCFRFGPRIIAARLHFSDMYGKPLKVFFVSAYAPHRNKRVRE